jgi:hypothetical protein
MKKGILKTNSAEEEKKISTWLIQNGFDELEDFELEEKKIKKKVSFRMRIMASVALGIMLCMGTGIVWQMEIINTQEQRIKSAEKNSFWQQTIARAVRDSLVEREKEILELKKK